MKKIFLILFMVLSVNAYSEVFGTARTLRAGTVMVGIDPQILMSPVEFQVNGHIGYGIIRNLDVDFRFGVGSVGFYIGGDLEYRLFHSRKLDFSISGGAHYQNNMFVDITPNVSYKFSIFSLYTGADMNWAIVQNASYFAVNWFVGADIPVRRNISVISEFSINFTNNYAHSISLGGAFYF